MTLIKHNKFEVKSKTQQISRLKKKSNSKDRPDSSTSRESNSSSSLLLVATSAALVLLWPWERRNLGRRERRNSTWESLLGFRNRAGKWECTEALWEYSFSIHDLQGLMNRFLSSKNCTLCCYYFSCKWTRCQIIGLPGSRCLSKPRKSEYVEIT